MANLIPKEFDITQINGGVEYVDGDEITPAAVNAPLESAAYMQGLVRNDNRPIVEEDQVDPTTRVRFQKHTISGVDFPQFIFTNIKGSKGDTGAMSLSLPVTQVYQQAPSSLGGNISVPLSNFNRTPVVGEQVSIRWYNEVSGLTYMCDGTVSSVSLISATVAYSNRILLSVTEANGLPSGGTTGQILKKKSNNDYDTEWQNVDSTPTANSTNLITSGAVYSAIFTALNTPV